LEEKKRGQIEKKEKTVKKKNIGVTAIVGERGGVNGKENRNPS